MTEGDIEMQRSLRLRVESMQPVGHSVKLGITSLMPKRSVIKAERYPLETYLVPRSVVAGQVVP